MVQVLASARKQPQSIPQLSHIVSERVMKTHMAHCDASQGSQPVKPYDALFVVQGTTSAVPLNCDDASQMAATSKPKERSSCVSTTLV
jgi:hypothetical protein